RSGAHEPERASRSERSEDVWLDQKHHPSTEEGENQARDESSFEKQRHAQNHGPESGDRDGFLEHAAAPEDDRRNEEARVKSGNAQRLADTPSQPMEQRHLAQHGPH